MIEIVLELLKKAWPYLLAGAVGFSAAWYIQGLRVDSVKNEFEAYKVEQQRLINEANVKADKQREESADEYRKNLAKLKNDSEVFKRCIAAGKCGGLSNLSGSTGLKLPSPGGANATGTNAVPATGESAPGVVADCAATTLQLNSLQIDIEKQGVK